MTEPDRPAPGPAVDELAAISALLTGPRPRPRSSRRPGGGWRS